jgi:predicted  nucleic acid-binding Zn-ribbon protein
MAQDYENVTSSVVEDLQILVQSRGKERVEHLTRAKAKLARCAETLEEIGQVHAMHVRQIHYRIRARDERHQEDVQDIKARGEARLARLRQELEIEEQRAAKVSKAADRLVAENLAEFSETAASFGKLPSRNPIPILDTAEQKSEIDQLQREILSLQALRETAESELAARRKENERLKREIGRFRHEIAFANRGPAKIRSGSID